MPAGADAAQGRAVNELLSTMNGQGILPAPKAEHDISGISSTDVQVPS